MTGFISPHTQPPLIAYYQLLADEPATRHVWKSWARTVSKATLPKSTHRARDTQPEPCSQVSVPRAAATNKARPEQHRHNRPWFLPVPEAASLRSRCHLEISAPPGAVWSAQVAERVSGQKMLPVTSPLPCSWEKQTASILPSSSKGWSCFSRPLPAEGPCRRLCTREKEHRMVSQL